MSRSLDPCGDHNQVMCGTCENMNTFEKELEDQAIAHANTVSDPEWDCWHKRYQSFKSGYARAADRMRGEILAQEGKNRRDINRSYFEVPLSVFGGMSAIEFGNKVGWDAVWGTFARMEILVQDKMREENQRLLDALRFYADREQWNITDPIGKAGFINSTDFDGFGFGGKRAREALGEGK